MDIAVQPLKRRSGTSPARSQTPIGVTASVIGVESTASRSPVRSSALGGVVGNRVLLPWPPSALSPNSRSHWAVRARAAKSYRAECCWLAKAADLRVSDEGVIHVGITFFPPSRHHFDDDNLVGRFKAGRDGLADALRVNDRRFRIHPALSDEVRPGGAVLVEIFKNVETTA